MLSAPSNSPTAVGGTESITSTSPDWRFARRMLESGMMVKITPSSATSSAA